MQQVQKGTKVSFKNRQDKLIKGVVKRQDVTGQLIINGDDGARYARNLDEVVIIGGTDDETDALDAQAPTDKATQTYIDRNNKLRNEFDINQRFDYLAQLVRMTISGTAVSLIITGEGGLGKTYTTKKEIQRKQLTKDVDYMLIKGYSTARGLYELLYNNNGMLLVFDDCDEVLEDKVAKNILKSALDSYDEREVCWISKSFSEDIPPSFIFTGRIIFISNMSQDNIQQAILSRSLNIDLTMTSEEKLMRMEYIINNSKDFMPTFDMTIKQEALTILKDNLADIRELSLRSLEKILKVLRGDSDMLDVNDPDYKNLDMRKLCRFMLLS